MNGAACVYRGNCGPGRKARGATLVFLLVIASCASIALMALVSLAAQFNGSVTRNEQQTRADYAMQGAIAAVRSQAYAGTLTVPSTQTFTIDGFSCTTTTSDNGGAIANSYKIDVSASRWGKTYSLSRVIGLPWSAANSLYRYAFGANAGCSFSINLFTRDTAHQADIYAKGTLNFGGFGSSVDGDADLTNPTTGWNVSVSGTKTTNYPARSWPTLNDTDYQNVADFTFGTHSVNSINFPSSNTVVVINGDMTYNGGTVTGTGTYYVTGNVYVNGDYSYANGSSMIAIICKGTFSPATGTNFVGIVFTNAAAWANGVTDNNGIVLVGTATTFSRTLDITYDPRIRDGGSTGKNMHLPGLWP